MLFSPPRLEENRKLELDLWSEWCDGIGLLDFATDLAESWIDLAEFTPAADMDVLCDEEDAAGGKEKD